MAPLAFDSSNQGRIAFGFFNIDVDMLLLERYFFFADLFCDRVLDLVCDGVLEPARGPKPASVFLDGWDIPSPVDRGDLMGAIAGISRRGFIGELYQAFPFPKDPGAFKQRPDGAKNRAAAVRIIEKHAVETQIPFSINAETRRAMIGEFEFDPGSFQELIDYVDRGGMPEWKDGKRPGYVARMTRGLSTVERFP
ncbi:conserved hypothetical protein [Candidatus Desulfarcum epimagneticum]|uniref:Uncharacterized protein n=1 Tax=uncultured Desulfobacteraceae bacterium TaxID=218296 RepID=A0A484HCW0_9BACT|nr:conserved hypothetical protein [uncultured Desulfobacteraceae bacterium]